MNFKINETRKEISKNSCCIQEYIINRLSCQIIEIITGNGEFLIDSLNYSKFNINCSCNQKNFDDSKMVEEGN